jgi:predicted PurR-regulated permease PerM
MYLEDELFALFEMKIIYAFKHLEINIKQLLSAAYDDKYINRQFKWDTIIQFLNSKEIITKDLNDYDNINQLRNLNNSLKHSNRTIDQTIKNIQEFQDKEVMSYSELENFYTRIKNSPNIFLTSLISFVFKDLYTFKHERILEISKSFALRMDKNVALEFSEALTNHYT